MTQTADVVESVRRACREADGQDPLDEAAWLQLKHHGLDGVRVWLSGTEGFALQRADQVDLAVAPGSRGRGIGRQLAALALADHAPVTACRTATTRLRHGCPTYTVWSGAGSCG